MTIVRAAEYATLSYYEADFDFGDTHTQMLIREENGVLEITYRGSDHFIDWINNFCFKATAETPYKSTGTSSKIEVHHGILQAYLSSRAVLHEKIIAANTTEIKFYGHSLGGCLAALAALDIQYNYALKPQVFLFGTPSFGNQHFADSYNKRVPNTLHAVNPHDPIPKLPMSLLGYVSIGEEQTVSPEWGQMTLGSFFRWLFTLPWQKTTLPLISAHNIEEYWYALRVKERA